MPEHDRRPGTPRNEPAMRSPIPTAPSIVIGRLGQSAASGGTGTRSRIASRIDAAETPRRLRSRSTTSRWARTGWTSALHVVRQHEPATGEDRGGLRRAIQRHGRPRARAELEVGVVAGRPDERDDVRLDLVADPDLADLVAQRDQGRPVGHRGDRLERLGEGLVAPGDRPFVRLGRVAEAGAQQEPVQLGLRQGERPLEFDRVLRREDDERIGQRAGHAFDGDLAFLHRLQEGRLGPRRGAVDLVDQQDVGEDRPFDEPERAALEQAGAGDVARQQVRRALDPGGRQAEGAGDGPGEQRLAGARDVLEQDVAVGQQGDRDQPEGVVPTDHGPADRLAQALPQEPAIGRRRRRVPRRRSVDGRQPAQDRRAGSRRRGSTRRRSGRRAGRSR